RPRRMLLDVPSPRTGGGTLDDDGFAVSYRRRTAESEAQNDAPACRVQAGAREASLQGIGGEQTLEARNEGGPGPAYGPELLARAEGAVARPMLDDSAGEHRADPRQRIQLRRRGVVELQWAKGPMGPGTRGGRRRARPALRLGRWSRPRLRH